MLPPFLGDYHDENNKPLPNIQHVPDNVLSIFCIVIHSVLTEFLRNSHSQEEVEAQRG